MLSSPAVKWSVYRQLITANQEPLVLKDQDFHSELDKSVTGSVASTQ